MLPHSQLLVVRLRVPRPPTQDIEMALLIDGVAIVTGAGKPYIIRPFLSMSTYLLHPHNQAVESAKNVPSLMLQRGRAELSWPT